MSTLNLSDEKPQKVKVATKFPKTLKTLIFLIIFAAAIAGSIIYIAKNHPTLIGLSENTQEKDKKDLESTIELVSKLMLLPEDEVPRLATITDADLRNGDLFYKNAQNGDKILIYTNAKKAVLYRPATNKIIEIGTVNLKEEIDVSEEPTATDSAQISPTTTPPTSPTQAPTTVPTIVIPTSPTPYTTP